MDKHQSKLFGFVCLLIALISVVYIFYAWRSSQNKSNTGNYPPSVAVASQAPLTAVESSDGKYKLTMKETKGKEGTAYVVSIINESDNTSNQIFTKTVPTDSAMIIPLNTFSPDDKYVFIKENDASSNSYFVMTTSGAEIAKDSQTFEISSLFAATKNTNYKITDVTGWGGMNLIVFNTDKVSGGIGPSFWFEVPSKAFIQLSNRFN